MVIAARSTTISGMILHASRLAERAEPRVGPEQILHFDLVGAEKAGLTCRVMGSETVVADEPVDLLFEAGACHVFDAAGERVALPAAVTSSPPPVRPVAPLAGGPGA